MADKAQRRKISTLSLYELRAELAACSSCKCRPCAIRAKDVAEFIAFRETEAAAVPVAEDVSQYDPVLLAVGIKMPKAKQKRLLEPAVKAATAKRFAKLQNFRRTVEGVAREQSYFDRFHGIRGTVVRG